MRTKILWIILTIVFIGCNEHIIYRNYINLGESWTFNKKVKFDIENFLVGEQNEFNVYIHLRNNNEYQYSNIFLIATLKDSINILEKDTLEYAMANSEGQWLGRGFLGLKESKLWWKKKYNFPSGNLIICEIEQVIRRNGEEFPDKELKGIVDVGFSIERAK